MEKRLDEKEWYLLLNRIESGECTPFLGAGACAGVLPLGADIANELSEKYGFPMKDSFHDLALVSQYLAVEYDHLFPKGRIIKKLSQIDPPDFNQPDEPHAVLADLPLPIYITTNYDDFMTQALKSRNRNARRELCQWNSFLRKRESIFDADSDYEPTPENPVVYHLHGHTDVKQSIVLTEDDYLDFLVNVYKDPNLLPPRIQEAFAGTSLLFLGYRLADWDFRVLFRSVVGYLEKSLGAKHVSVQLVPGVGRMSMHEQDKVQEYLRKYFEKLDIRVFWGTCREFAAELRQRWEDFSRDD